VSVGALDQFFELTQLFLARSLATGVGDLAETVRDIFEQEWSCG
jgi:hypothetical protein